MNSLFNHLRSTGFWRELLPLFISVLFFGTSVVLPAQTPDTTGYAQLIKDVDNNKLPFDTALMRLKTAINNIKNTEYYKLLGSLYLTKGGLFFDKGDFENALINYRWAHNILKNERTDVYFNSIVDLTNVFYYLNEPDSIYYYAKKGLEQAELENNRLAVGQMYNQLGTCYELKEDRPKALKAYLKSLNIFESLQKKPLIVKEWINIGIIYQNMGDYDAAKQYFFKALKYGEKHNLNIYISTAVNNLGSVYNYEKKYDSALIFFKKSLELDTKRGDKYDMAASLLNIAATEAKLGNYKESYRSLKRVIQVAEKNNYTELLIYAFTNSGDLFSDTNSVFFNADSAIYYYSQLLEIATKSGNLEDLSTAYYGLQKTYGLKGDYAKGYEFADKYIEVSDSLVNIKKTKQLQEIKEKYETEKKEKEYLLLQQKSERIRLNFILILAVAIFSIMVLAVLLRIRMLKNRQLRQQQRFVDNLLQYDSSYILVMSKAGIITFQSPSVRRDLGDVNKKDLFGIILPEDLNNVLQILENVQSGMVARAPFECRIYNKKGEIRYITGMVSDKLNDPLLKGLLINFWDYTTQKEYERELEESERRYRSIFEAFPDVFFRIDNKGTIIELSPSVKDVAGYKREELLGKDYKTLLISKQQIEQAAKIIEETGELSDFTLEIPMASNQIIIASITAKKITDENGMVTGFEGVLRDITERVEQENKLREANETKDQLFSIIAHDLVGPIGMQKNILDLVLTDIDTMSKEEIISFLSTIKPSLDATFFMIENLLSWARIMRNTIQPSINTHNVYKVITQAFDFLVTQANSKNIRFEFEGDKNLKADFDINMLDIILRNLITNAIKFSPKGEIITVSATKADGSVRISVIDRGIGIPPEILEELRKEKHKSQSRVGTSNEKGTGLGLVVVKEFLLKLGSKLYISSEEGKGSVFYFDLPAA